MTSPPDLGRRGGQATLGDDGNKLRRAILERTPKGSDTIDVVETPGGVETSVKLWPKVLEEFYPPIGPSSGQWPSWLDGSTGGLHELLATAGQAVGSWALKLLRAGTDEVDVAEWPYTGSKWITGATEPSPLEEATGTEWALAAFGSGFAIEGTVGETWTSGDWEAAFEAGRFRPAVLVILSAYVPLLDGWDDSIIGANCLTDRAPGKTAIVQAAGEWIEWQCVESDVAALECTLYVPLLPAGPCLARGEAAVPPEMLAHCEPGSIVAVSAWAGHQVATANVKEGRCEVLAAIPPTGRAGLARVRLQGVRKGMGQAWPRSDAKVAKRNERHYRV